MAIEVEIKARLDDPASLAALLDSLGRRIRSFDKRDRYYAQVPVVAESRFRLRVDDGSAVCTFKRKTISAGIEVNDESEFHVSDAESFDAFAAFLGFECVIEKRKTGTAWLVDGTTCELSEVAGLGHYIELEILLADGAAEADLDRARGRLLDLLARLSLPASAVEARPYTEMLDAIRRANEAPARPTV